MRKSGFTLVELIFVIVIIGVLAAVAVPKFKDLKQNAGISNMVKPIAQVNENGHSAYLNEKELNEQSNSDINLTGEAGMFDFKGKGWSSSSDDKSVYVLDDDNNITLEYTNDGNVSITVVATSDVLSKVNTKTGITFVSGTAKEFDLK